MKKCFYKITCQAGLVCMALLQLPAAAHAKAFERPLALTDQRSEFTIRGKVTSAEKEPLPGVTIVVKGTSQGTTTDADGQFTLNLAGPGAVLTDSFIGYAIPFGLLALYCAMFHTRFTFFLIIAATPLLSSAPSSVRPLAVMMP